MHVHRGRIRMCVCERGVLDSNERVCMCNSHATRGRMCVFSPRVPWPCQAWGATTQPMTITPFSLHAHATRTRALSCTHCTRPLTASPTCHIKLYTIILPDRWVHLRRRQRTQQRHSNHHFGRSHRTQRPHGAPSPSATRRASQQDQPLQPLPHLHPRQPS